MKKMIYALGFFLYYTKLYRSIIYLRRHAKKILVYHNVGNDNSFIEGLNISVSVEAFNKHMVFLNKHYNVVSLGTLIARQEENKKSSRMVAITFDDGYKTFIDKAYPILQAHKYAATVFIIKKCIVDNLYMWVNSVCYAACENEACAIESDIFKDKYKKKRLNNIDKNRSIGKQSRDNIVNMGPKEMERYAANLAERIETPASDLYLTREDCRFLSQHDVDFGNHSLSHFNFSTLDEHEIREEVSTWNEPMEGINFKHQWLALPFGRPLKNQEKVESILKRADMKLVLFSNGLDNSQEASMYKLGRHHLTSDKEYRIFTEMELLPFFRIVVNKIKYLLSRFQQNY